MEEKYEILRTADLSAYPDFHIYSTPLERALWILWIAKDLLQIRRLTAEQVASIIINCKEISITAKAIINAFNRAGNKVHTYRDNENVEYEIMKPGKDYLLSKIKDDSTEILYFEPEKRFTNKRILSSKLLQYLTGDLRIVDPYCNMRTLDVLAGLKVSIKYMTNINNLRALDRETFLRELKDFRSEKINVEFKTYANSDIHDRYILSCDRLIILGHSLKDFGSKETFVVNFDRKTTAGVYDALSENFDRRWKISNMI